LNYFLHFYLLINLFRRLNTFRLIPLTNSLGPDGVGVGLGPIVGVDVAVGGTGVSVAVGGTGVSVEVGTGVSVGVNVGVGVSVGVKVGVGVNKISITTVVFVVSVSKSASDIRKITLYALTSGI
jgi:hypothetical protein